MPLVEPSRSDCDSKDPSSFVPRPGKPESHNTGKMNYLEAFTKHREEMDRRAARIPSKRQDGYGPPVFDDRYGYWKVESEKSPKRTKLWNDEKQTWVDLCGPKQDLSDTEEPKMLKETGRKNTMTEKLLKAAGSWLSFKKS